MKGAFRKPTSIRYARVTSKYFGVHA